jgi:hypothetical protein
LQGYMVVVNSWGIGTDHFGGYAGKERHVSYVSNVFFVSNVSYVSNVKRFYVFKRFLSSER